VLGFRFSNSSVVAVDHYGEVGYAITP